jgi:hypothetical protein
VSGPVRLERFFTARLDRLQQSVAAAARTDEDVELTPPPCRRHTTHLSPWAGERTRQNKEAPPDWRVHRRGARGDTGA